MSRRKRGSGKGLVHKRYISIFLEVLKFEDKFIVDVPIEDIHKVFMQVIGELSTTQLREEPNHQLTEELVNKILDVFEKRFNK